MMPSMPTADPKRQRQRPNRAHLAPACATAAGCSCTSTRMRRSPMFAPRDIVVAAVITGVLSAVVLWIWPWGRVRGRFALGALTTAVGLMAWNFTLDHTNAVGFDVDAPVIRVSWQDAGSAVLAFAVTALVLGLGTERHESAQRAVGAAAIVGLVALVYDIFLF